VTRTLRERRDCNLGEQLANTPADQLIGYPHRSLAETILFCQPNSNDFGERCKAPRGKMDLTMLSSRRQTLLTCSPRRCTRNSIELVWSVKSKARRMPLPNSCNFSQTGKRQRTTPNYHLRAEHGIVDMDKTLTRKRGWISRTALCVLLFVGSANAGDQNLIQLENKAYPRRHCFCPTNTEYRSKGPCSGSRGLRCAGETPLDNAIRLNFRPLMTEGEVVDRGQYQSLALDVATWTLEAAADPKF
jgi:hypothetical protein